VPVTRPAATGVNAIKGTPATDLPAQVKNHLINGRLFPTEIADIINSLMRRRSFYGNRIKNIIITLDVIVTGELFLVSRYNTSKMPTIFNVGNLQN